MTKYQGLIRLIKVDYYDVPSQFIVLSTELLYSAGGYNSDYFIKMIENKIISSTNSTHIADLWVVDLFIKIGENFDKAWDEIYKSRRGK